MTSSINTILIIGATSGIGAAFARYFHSQGKKVIITGRRTDRLNALASALPGLETYAMDNNNLSSLPDHVNTLTSKYPEIDSVWINSGIQQAYSFKDAKPEMSDEQIINEINLNATSYVLLAKHFLPHLQSLGKEANLIMTSSGLGYTPFPFGPVYSATKAFLHSLCVSLRINLKETDVNVIEIVPPYVDVSTDSDTSTKSSIMHAISLKEFVEGALETWENVPAKQIREIVVGTAKLRVDKWRGAMQGVWEGFGISEN